MAKTMQDQFVTDVTEHGWKEKIGGSFKYRVFYHERLEGNIYLGRAGAFRFGRTIAESHPIGPRSRERIMKEGW